MKIYDVTLPITNDMLVWEGDAPVSLLQIASVEKDGVSLSNFNFGSHTGTHIDAPSHFLEKGTGIDKISLEKLTGECRVLDLTGVSKNEISVSDLKPFDIKRGDRILFKTGNFKLLKKNKFPDSYVSLSLEGAKFLAGKEIFLVGTDFLGIEKKGSPGHPVHKTFLSKGIVIVEGLDLEKVPEGSYKIICLPLRVDSDGSPARVVLISQKL